MGSRPSAGVAVEWRACGTVLRRDAGRGVAGAADAFGAAGTGAGSAPGGAAVGARLLPGGLGLLAGRRVERGGGHVLLLDALGDLAAAPGRVAEAVVAVGHAAAVEVGVGVGVDDGVVLVVALANWLGEGGGNVLVGLPGCTA